MNLTSTHHQRGYWSIVCTLAASLVSTFFAAPLLAATNDQVEQAITRAKAHLYSLQHDGNWEGTDAAGGRGGRGARPGQPPAGGQEQLTQRGGLTALVTYALLASGESQQDARIQRALDYLKKTEITGIYALGMRCQVWTFLYRTEEYRALIKKDATALVAAAKPVAGIGAFYRYSLTSTDYDHSASQYGVLGAWACAETGFEIPTTYWKAVDTGWRAHQLPDGAWDYKGEKAPRASMTAAGIATLFITQEYLHAGDGVECKGNIVDPNVDKALKWMAAHFNEVLQGRRSLYTLYGVERIGVASGYKYFGTVDWYHDGAEYLVKDQEGSGAWGDTSDTAFGMIFLVRGRAPVVMNKLQYEIDLAGDIPRPVNWDQRPRDAANMVHWMSKQLERYLNWQIVNLKVSIDDLHDAPILYIAGNQALNFTEPELQKLRLYVEQGGIILGNADCSSDAFDKSFVKLGNKLFPMYEFRELPKDHVIYTREQFPSEFWKNKPRVMGLSNGVREMMILFPTGDPARFWQTQTYGGREEFHQVLDDIFLYSVEKQDLRFKGQTYILHKDGGSASQTVKVARIEYGGNWNPEPGGWARLGAYLHNTLHTDVETKPIRLGSGKLDSSFKVAHITGTVAFHLDDAARAELKAFVEGGGTLLIDAAGGSATFATSAEAELPAIFGEPIAKIEVLKPDHPVFSAGIKTTEITYRKFAARTVGTLKTPRLRGLEINGRTAVFYSPEDLSGGLVGEPMDGIFGYDPKTATSLVSNILMYAGASKGAASSTPTASTPPSTPPTRQPPPRTPPTGRGATPPGRPRP